jgi:hypothetical protein
LALPINDFGRDPTYLALDDHPNIEMRMFNPSRARKGRLRRGLEMTMRPFSLARRMHNKAWIADGMLAIVGGRNIGDGYFDAAETSNFRDLDLLSSGTRCTRQKASSINIGTAQSLFRSAPYRNRAVLTERRSANGLWIR